MGSPAHREPTSPWLNCPLKAARRARSSWEASKEPTVSDFFVCKIFKLQEAELFSLNSSRQNFAVWKNYVSIDPRKQKLIFVLSKAPRPLPQSWSSPHHSTLQRHPAMAPRPLPHTIAHYNGTQQWSNGTTSTPPKLVVTLPPNQSTLQWHIAMAPRPLRQWHHVPSPKVGRHPPPTIAHYNGTLQWHHVHSAKVGRHPPNHSTLQCHHVHSPKVGRHPPPTTIAHYNGTQQWHHLHSTIAHYNDTLQWHPAMAPRPLNQSWSSPCPQP